MDPLATQQRIVSEPTRGSERSGDDIKSLVISFFTTFTKADDVQPYIRSIKNILETHDSLVINVGDIRGHSPQLYDRLVVQPTHVLQVITQVVESMLAEESSGSTPYLKPSIVLQYTSLNGSLRPSELRAKHINRLVSVRAIVSGTSRLRSKTQLLVAKCRGCGHEYRQILVSGLDTIVLPTTCLSEKAQGDSSKCGKSPYIINPHSCVYIDQQSIKLQDIPGDMPFYRPTGGDDIEGLEGLEGGAQAGTAEDGSSTVLPTVLEGHVVKPDLLAGCKLIVTGTLVAKPGTKIVYLLGHGIHVVDSVDEFDHIQTVQNFYSAEDIPKFHTFKNQPNLISVIESLIAPQIEGMEDAKRAIACLLFGGTNKYTQELIRLRGNINVLLISDPGLGKSELLLEASRLAPTGIYTSGKSTSAVGLTAGVMRDKATGEFFLEGGALVLADKGIVCIDELDKMNETDRVALHEAMEQGSISISKAGISTTLNARTSILAAANPTLGRFDDFQKAADQIDFSVTILTRFDLVFMLKDKQSPEKDAMIVNKIARIATGERPASVASHQEQNPMFTQAFLKKYIAYAQATCTPKLDQSSLEILKAAYIRYRADALKNNSAIPITVRQLEALIRISESFAKMRLSPVVTVEDVEYAIDIFQKSTADALQAGISDPSLTNSTIIAQAEQTLLRMIPYGTILSKSAVLRDSARLGLSEAVVVYVITKLINSNILEVIRSTMLKRK
ncbi:MCM5 [Giardia lamblia P15]|uniref:DNA helicase n=1 Tax=Giardia intestinalis (strain P15) TaxID=658858 RepID=E1F977_GIAIA|nr:MCM5 [Giardia lamblia P15]